MNSRRRTPETRASPLAVGPLHPQPTTDPVLGPWGRPESFWIATRRSAPPGRRSKDSTANKALLRREISIPALCQLWVIRAERPQHFSISPLRR